MKSYEKNRLDIILFDFIVLFISHDKFIKIIKIKNILKQTNSKNI